MITKRGAVSTGNSLPGRFAGMRRREGAPFCLSFANDGPVRVIKRNSEGDSVYRKKTAPGKTTRPGRKKGEGNMYITVNGVRLYYEKTGAGRPLVMVHCNSMDHKIFRRAVKTLAQRFTVYCPDSRDHGKSEKVKTLHYKDMAEDMFRFIEALGLEKPAFYGFSDGGIIGLLLAGEHPDLLSALIVSGASLRPDSTKDLPLRFFRLWSHVDRSDKMRIMLREPDITDEMLRRIRVPTFVTAGERDVIKPSHTRHIAETVPGAELKIFSGAGHTGYIVNSTKIASYILSVLPENG